MMAPAQAAARFAAACYAGLWLGVAYGFLRPLRPKRTTLAGLAFVLFAGWVLVYLTFGICGGDLRFGYLLGTAAAGFAWELTVGRLLRPVFAGFWKTHCPG